MVGAPGSEGSGCEWTVGVCRIRGVGWYGGAWLVWCGGCSRAVLGFAAPAGATTLTSFTTPGQYSVTVPVGVTSIDVTAVGAAGGGTASTGGRGASAGGLPASVAVPAASGELLLVTVGGVGADGFSSTAGGVGGGGAGGFSFVNGGGGGGASVVADASPFATSPLVAAGGGGGAEEGGNPLFARIPSRAVAAVVAATTVPAVVAGAVSPFRGGWRGRVALRGSAGDGHHVCGKGGICLSQVEVRQGRSMAGTGGDRIGSVGRGSPGSPSPPAAPHQPT
jgi:hypothetical protein